ncbi:hypothetical protein BFJ63_vAg14398 [Fusarium oxysporum f. sp. narcissi]|uniref:Uncharacterized protein n=1 Tax=Fusarium oxysporum f. sp. narcissi TaxID=451672 RepID=A0A4Q2V7G1_FUSOX|nr:hypothetical protein BFJ63_vAg14398 [Fusarium oxysporum f. sp. narcissi]
MDYFLFFLGIDGPRYALRMRKLRMAIDLPEFDDLLSKLAKLHYTEHGINVEVCLNEFPEGAARVSKNIISWLRK